ncbi:50S ribosomal protein L19 [Candidatus Parcubacteria bacterium A4]|nr:MAG: 50S ribosomal protein L19 [Candidatus Parcubacteria bacterium A4]
MTDKTNLFDQKQLKSEELDVRPGDTVKVSQKIKDKDKERIQIFEGLVIDRKHGKGISATITVRKIIADVGVEIIFPIHSPHIEKIEVIKRGKVRRAKLFYLRGTKGKKSRLKSLEIPKQTAAEEPAKPAEIAKEEA